MAENPYTSQTVVGYNDSPPPDDGSRTAANALTWDKHITKIGDPLNAHSAAIDSETQSAFGELVMTTDPGEETVVIAMQEFGVR